MSCKNSSDVPKSNWKFDKKEEKADTITIKKQLDSINFITKSGDILFRGGTDAESNIIRDFSYNDKIFSHCGIVLPTDSGLRVAHMLGGTTNPAGGLLYSSIEKFLSYPENESAGIYGCALSKKELRKIHQYTDSIKNNNIGFDLKFDLATKQNLYCTEMLVDAIKFAKGNNTILTATSFYLKNTKYFFLANKGR